MRILINSDFSRISPLIQILMIDSGLSQYILSIYYSSWGASSNFDRLGGVKRKFLIQVEPKVLRWRENGVSPKSLPI